MSKIRYTVRFYRQHDLDLITFFITHEFNVMRGIYTSLTAFAKGEVFVIDIPPERNIPMPQLKRLYTKALILDEEKDAAAIALLSLVKDGYRNNFLKNLLRQYLCCPISEEFLVEKGNMPYFNTKFEVFREGKRKVKAGKISSASGKKQAAADHLKEEKVPNISADSPKPVVEEKETIRSNVKTEIPDPKGKDNMAADDTTTIDDANEEELLSYFNDVLSGGV